MTRLPHPERTSPHLQLLRQPGGDDTRPLYTIATGEGAVLHRDLDRARACVLFDDLARAADAATPPPRPRRHR